MKKSQKHVLKGMAMPCSAGGSYVEQGESSMADLNLDPRSVAAFAGIHASREFTVEAAYRAFAGIKRKK